LRATWPIKARAQGNALAEGPAAFPGFGLDHHFARGILQHADAEVIVGQAGFKLLGDFGEHLVRIERGDSVPRNGIEQREVPGLGAFLVE